MPDIKITHQLDPAKWKRFVDENPCGNVFHTPEMSEVFARAKGHQPVLWAATHANGDILALLPIVRLTLFDGLLKRWTTRAIAYGSVLCEHSERGHVALETLLQAYKKGMGRQALFTEFRNLSDLQDLQPVLQKQEFAYEDHLDYIHDLTLPEETLWRNIDQRKRSKIRACAKKQIVVEETTDPGKLELAYGFLQGVYDRVQVPLADISLFRSALDILAPAGMFKILLARAGDRYAATSLALLYHGRVYWWYIGSDRSLGHLGASELLVWHAMTWGREHGFEIFDFGGGGKPDQEYGPRQFKRQFGGVQVNYGRNLCVHAPLRLRLCEFGYNTYRQVSLQLSSAQVKEAVDASSGSR